MGCGKWFEGYDHVDFHRGILRQLIDPEGRAGVHPGLGKDRIEHFGGRVGDFALLGEVGGALHIDVEPQDFFTRCRSPSNWARIARARMVQIRAAYRPSSSETSPPTRPTTFTVLSMRGICPLTYTSSPFCTAGT